MQTINVLCPTRGRAVELTEMYQSLCATADSPADVQLVLGVDAEDTATLDAISQWERLINFRTVVASRKRDLASYFNSLVWYGSGVNGIYQLAADDIRYRTQGWDTRVRAAFAGLPDRIALVFARDREDASIPEHCATHPFLHWGWLAATGYLVPPYLSRCIDRWLLDVAKRINRTVYLGDVFIPSPTRQERTTIDDTLAALDERIQWDNDLHAAREDQRNADVAKLTARMVR